MNDPLLDAVKKTKSEIPRKIVKLPPPRVGWESRETWLNRCMSNSIYKREFPNKQFRIKVCKKQWLNFNNSKLKLK